jgi:hypothetical protein
MAETRISFGEWTPDQPGIAGALQEASNVVPQGVGYGPYPALVDYSQAASEDLTGVFTGDSGAVSALFAGGATKLFRMNATTYAMADVSASGGYSAGSRWRFCQFGNNVIATNGNNNPQSFVLGSSSAFADLGGSPPVAEFVTVVRDFVVLGKVSNYPNRVQWSDINNETNWTSSTSSQADIQDIPDGGEVRGITGGEFGLILMDKSIVRMSYIGAPLFFQFDTISRNRGCFEPGSVVSYGTQTYFLSDDGFYVSNGQSVQAIGAEKIDRWFFDNAAPDTFGTMTAGIDPLRNIVVWAFDNVAGGRSLLIFNWQLNRWSHGTTDAEYFGSAASGTVTLESLDTVSSSIDALGTSLDSRQWVGGKITFGATRGAKVATFTGDQTDASLVTGDFGDGKQSVVTLARPQVDGGSASVQISSRLNLATAPFFGTAATADSDNRVPLRSFGRYHRLKVVPTGDWTNAVAIDVDVTATGAR